MIHPHLMPAALMLLLNTGGCAWQLCAKDDQPTKRIGSLVALSLYVVAIALLFRP